MTKEKRQGFASMDRRTHLSISSKAGMAVDPKNRAFSKSKRLASEAGRKGGLARKTQRGWRWCSAGAHFWHVVPGTTEYRPESSTRVTHETCMTHAGRR